MTFEPYPTRSGIVSLGLAVVFGVAVILFLTLLLQQHDPTTMFRLFVGLLLALVITLIALYWTAISGKLVYHLNRNGLEIQWGLTQHRIPFENIENVIPGQDVSTSTRFWGLNIFGLRLGWGRWPERGLLKFYATAPVSDSVLVVTAERTYVISPRQSTRFLQAWQERQTLGPTQHWPAEVRRSWPLNTPLLVDRLAWGLLGIAFLLWLALLGYIAFTFTELPSVLPVHFNTLGRADRIAEKSTLLILPAVGAIVLIANALLGELVYRREKLAAYFLWGSAIVMQVCLWVALLTIVG
jgi:hypothetical protein